MQVVSYFLFHVQRKSYNFSKWKVVKTPTHSLDSPYAEHGNPPFHTERYLNQLTHEYIKHD
jgi:hypothetical protein